ncbi:MAG: hypothetical protein ACLU06_00490 [Eggerthellaceae bacterium]
MNRCKNCGAEFDSPFCPYCGTKAEETTPYQESKKDNETPAPEAQAGKHEAENTPATSPTAPESTASNAAPEPAGDPVVGIPQPNAASNSADEQPETPPATSHTQGGPSPMPPKGPIAPQHATQESDNAEFQPPSQPDKEPVYIYKKLWFIGLITFLCPIAGIILAVVQKKPAKKAERAALIVVACIWMIAGIAIMGSMGSSSSTTGTASSTSSTSSSYNSSSQTSTTTPKKAEKSCLALLQHTLATRFPAPLLMTAIPELPLKLLILTAPRKPLLAGRLPIPEHLLVALLTPSIFPIRAKRAPWKLFLSLPKTNTRLPAANIPMRT